MGPAITVGHNIEIVETTFNAVPTAPNTSIPDMSPSVKATLQIVSLSLFHDQKE